MSPRGGEGEPAERAESSGAWACGWLTALVLDGFLAPGPAPRGAQRHGQLRYLHILPVSLQFPEAILNELCLAIRESVTTKRETRDSIRLAHRVPPGRERLAPTRDCHVQSRGLARWSRHWWRSNATR